MKKINCMKTLAVMLATAVAFGSAGCVATQDGGSAADDDKLKIVATIFPEYDWVMNILGDELAGEAEVTMLLDEGVDLHSYQPTSDDMIRIAGCDLFIYVGGESDEWVEDALEAATNDKLVAVNLLEELGTAVKEEEVKEGMQADHDHEDGEEDHDHEEDHEEGEEAHDHGHEETEYDEHVWLSLRNSAILCDSIARALGEVDPDNASVYKDNADAYISKLNDLDKEYSQAVSEGTVKTLLFGDRFPFRYMTDDYGLDYYAAFVGCSAETEASFETITFLADKIDELSLGSVMTIEGTDHRIAETIIENTAAKDQQILVLDSMQSTTSKDVQNGASYIMIMEKNLDVIKEALK